MFTNDHWKRAETLFANQFKPDGSSYLYRRRSIGPAYRVSPAERDQWIERYKRAFKRLIWTMVTITILSIFVATTIASLNDIELHPAWPLALAIPMSGVIALLGIRIFDAPQADLGARLPIADALPKADARRVGLASTSWRNLAAYVALGLFGAWRLLGWTLWGWIVGGALALLFAAAAYRKWRYGRPAAP